MKNFRKMLCFVLVLVVALGVLVGCTGQDIESISIKTPAQTEFNVGDEFNSDGLVVEAVLSDGAKQEIKAKDITIDSNDYVAGVAGTYTIKVKYKDFETSYTVTVKAPTPNIPVTVTSLELSSAKTSFIWNEDFSVGNLKVTKVMSDNTKAALTSDEYTVDSSNYNKAKAGTYKIVVTLNADTSIKAEYNVTVEAPAMTKIEVTNAKTSFEYNEAFSLGDIVVTATYKDNTTKVLTADKYTVNSESFDCSIPGSYKIVVSSNDYTSIKANYNVTVKSAIIVSQTPQTIYLKNENFNASGIVVKNITEDGQTALTKDLYTIDSTNFKKGVVGEYDIVVKLNADETKTATFKVFVKETKGYVNLTVEAFTIGAGYIIEPTRVPFAEGEFYSDVLLRAISQNNLGAKYGYGQWGFYFEAILDGYQTDCTRPNPNSTKGELNITNDPLPTIPEYLLNGVYANLGQTSETLTKDGNKLYGPGRKVGGTTYATGLGQGSFNGQSGWMDSVNNAQSMGLGATVPQNDDVFRFQFTLYGYGQDLDFVWAPDYSQLVKTPVDKTALIKKLATIKANGETAKYPEYANALAVASNVAATEENVKAAVDSLLPVTKIEVTDNSKPVYENGSYFDTSALTVMATVGDKQVQLAPSKISYSGFNKKQVGKQTVTIKFAGDTSIKTTIEVTVNEPFTTKIEAQTIVNNYLVDAPFVNERVNVYNVLNNGDKILLDSSAYAVDSSSYKANTPGEYAIKYTLNSDDSFTTTLMVKVKAVVGNVVFSVEALPFGEAFIEPIKVPFGEGDTVVDALTRALDLGGFGMEYNMLSTGFYLQAIYDGNQTDMTETTKASNPKDVFYRYLGSNAGVINILDENPVIPDNVAAVYTEQGYYDFMFDEKASVKYGTVREGKYATALGANSYDSGDMPALGGWMFTVNNVFPSVYANDVVLKNNDVVRFQYSAYFAGADIGSDMLDFVAIPQKNKDALATKIAEVKAANKQAELGVKYTNALKVYKNLLATEEEIATCVTDLTLTTTSELPQAA